jgi:hypothetical protein
MKTNKARQTKAQRFFFRVPNIVLELGLTPYEFALYCAIRRTTGDDGVCFRSGVTLARLCRMSTGQVSRCKKRLQAPDEKLAGKPLIWIVERPSRHGGKAYHEIRVVDIWDENEKHFSDCQSVSPSADELATSDGEIATALPETKKTPQRKLPLEEEPPSLSPSPREAERESGEISEFWSFLCTLFRRTDSRGPTRTDKKQMIHLLPIPPEEYKLVKWWMGLDNRRYDWREGVGFSLRRRPQSISALLKNWSAVNDVARQYWKLHCEIGFP